MTIIMKLVTLKAFITLTFLILTIFSCKKERDKQYMNNAEIIGYDARTCVCCGGTKITIDNVQNPNGNSYFLICNLPSNFTIRENPRLPIAVKLDWKIDTAHCFGNYIDITRIAKR